MPCNSDYMNPTKKELRLKETAEFLVFVRKKTGRHVDKKLRETSEAIYPKIDYVSELCYEIGNLSEDMLDAVVYNGRDKRSRKLADWWEEHQKADKQRIVHEKKVKNLLKERSDALNRLTLREKQLLGIEPGLSEGDLKIMNSLQFRLP